MDISNTWVLLDISPAPRQRCRGDADHFPLSWMMSGGARALWRFRTGQAPIGSVPSNGVCQAERATGHLRDACRSCSLKVSRAYSRSPPFGRSSSSSEMVPLPAPPARLGSL